MRILASKRLRALVAAAGAFALSAGSAEAVQQHTIAGSACHGNNSVSACVSASAGTFNPGETTCVATCPITRDSINNTNGLSQLWVTGSGITCTFESTSVSGVVADTETKAVNGNVQFTGITASSSLGMYSLTCTIPPGGEIRRVRWDEF